MNEHCDSADSYNETDTCNKPTAIVMQTTIIKLTVIVMTMTIIKQQPV